ncbi:MAG: hypothetical protein C0502_05445 [Opitutus sp.]|nr:hypothetical protein [Opitutus sp.]
MPPLLSDFLALLRAYLAAAISVGVLLAAGAAGYGFLLYAHELAAEQQALQKRGDEMFAAIARQKRMDGLVATTRAAVAHLDSQLAIENELAANLDRFYQLENSTGVRLVSINQLNPPALAPGAPAPTYTALPFTLQISGSYAQVMQFLHEVEYGPLLARISTCNLNRAGGSGPVQGAEAPADTLLADLTVELLGHP